MTLPPGPLPPAPSPAATSERMPSVVPPAGAPPDRMPRWAKVLLFVVLPALVILAVAAVILLAFVLRGSGYTDVLESRAGSRVEVRIPHAGLEFAPGAAGELRVEASGSYIGRQPRIEINNARNNTTEITGGCRGGWLDLCRIRVTVFLPESTDLDVEAQNGGISVEGLTGSLSLATRNGAVLVQNPAGPLELSTTNGGVQINGATSADIIARSTNGRIDLDCADAPKTVDAETVNGAVTITVPAGPTTYNVLAGAINGRVDTASVPDDPSARRTISAQTVNGAVTVRVADG